MIRVVLPTQLRTLAGVTGEVSLEIAEPTQRAVIDALESRFPPLRGTIRDPETDRRRPFLRFYALEEDLSDLDPDAPLPPEVQRGREPFIVLGAIAGG